MYLEVRRRTSINIYLMKIKFIMEFKLGDQALSTVKKVIEILTLLLSAVASILTIIQFIH